MPLTLEMKLSTLPQNCLTVVLKFGTAEQKVARQQRRPITGSKTKSSSEKESEKEKKNLKKKLERNFRKLTLKQVLFILSE